MATRVSKEVSGKSFKLFTVLDGRWDQKTDDGLREITASPVGVLGGHHLSVVRGEQRHLVGEAFSGSQARELRLSGGGGVQYIVVYEAEPIPIV